MRLLSLTVRNYRVHREFTVAFDPLRNVIGGPNESGKSTLAEAAHRALFLRAKTGGAIQEEMVSKRHLGGAPEVVLAFDAEGTEWEVKKSFAGSSKGGTLLTNKQGLSLRNDEAEARLAELLRTEAAKSRLSAKELPTVWSHLWVRQGQSSEDPAGQVTGHRDTLLQRLQKDGAAAVMQSALDQVVADRVAEMNAEFFTPGGKLRAGSKPDLAKKELDEAAAAWQKAEEAAARLRETIAEHEQAEQEIAEAGGQLPSLKESLAETEARLQEAEGLGHEEEKLRRVWESAQATLAQLAETERQVAETGEKHARQKAALEPAEEKLKALAEAGQAAREASRLGDERSAQAASRVRGARLRHELAAAWVRCLEKQEAEAKLRQRAGELEGIERELAELRGKKAALPKVARKDLERLDKLDREAVSAAAALEAMATGLELLEASGPVLLDGEPLRPGESRVLTAMGEITLGSGTRLRIRPGGGDSLGEARRRGEEALRSLKSALDSLALASLEQAQETVEQLAGLQQRIEQRESVWKTLGGGELAKELAAAILERESAEAEAGRRLSLVEGAGEEALQAPADLPAAKSGLQAARESLDAAEREEGEARGAAERSRAALETAASAHEKQRVLFSEALGQLRDLETRLRVLEESLGGGAKRQELKALTLHQEQQSGEALREIRQKLQALDPGTLTQDRERFERSLRRLEERLREAEKRRHSAQDRLRLDGSHHDPEAARIEARARHETARERHASEERRAQAVGRLHGLFTSSREAIDRSVSQPLADRVSGYLQCLFGSGAGVALNLADGGIDLVRPGDPSFGFATLSGGTKEQVAAAVRLAMAEILALDHGGSLPIVFDDAFACTDPERLRSLQRMLDLAASRGLQVIVFTCNPADYTAFGARELRIAQPVKGLPAGANDLVVHG